MRSYVTFVSGFFLGALALFGFLFVSGSLVIAPRQSPIVAQSPTDAPPPTVAALPRDSGSAKAEQAPRRYPTTPRVIAAQVAGIEPVLGPTSVVIPVVGITREELRDHFNDMRGGGRPHRAIDIMAPKGRPVVAAVDGQVRKLFVSKAGGLTIYQFDQSETLVYYYAHLDSYATGLTEGARVKKGDVLGFVGSTGNANPAGPHLHFSIERLPPTKEWWKGEPINPYPILFERGVTYRIEQ